jgi:hypothetical protein
MSAMARPRSRPAPTWIFSWTGALDDFGIFSGTLKPDGLVGGAQFGYNWQADSLVFGIEGDISFTDWGQRTTVFDTDAGDLGGPDVDNFAFGTVSADVDFLASVRGRLGFAFDSLLIYGTGGVAWADAQARARVVAYDDGIPLQGVLTGKKSLNDFGFVAAVVRLDGHSPDLQRRRGRSVLLLRQEEDLDRRSTSGC